MPELWSTIQLDMVADDGRWLVDGWEITPGPSPAPAPDVALARDVTRWRRCWRGRRPRWAAADAADSRVCRTRSSIFTGFVSTAVGWAWDKVVQGIFTWFAEGLLLLIEFVWGLLDTATTPRLTDDWFVNGSWRRWRRSRCS